MSLKITTRNNHFSNNIIKSLERDLLPRAFEYTVVSLLKNRRLFKPDFLHQISELFQIAEENKNSLIENLDEEDRFKADIDCCKGCYYCCGMEVKPTMPELYLILEYIEEHYSKPEINQLISDLQKQIKDRENSQSICERVKVYCTFLRDGICSIEEVKPLSCRAYSSTDVEICKKFVYNPVIDIPLSICHYYPYDITRKAIMKSLYIAGFSDVIEELNTGILRLLLGEHGQDA